MTEDVYKRQVFHGSALRDEGVKELLDVMSLLAPSYAAPASDEFSARVYKIRHDGPTPVSYTHLGFAHCRSTKLYY